MQATGDGEYLIGTLITVLVNYSIDVAFPLAPDKHRTMLSECHFACIGHVIRIDRDGKTWRKRDALYSERARVSFRREKKGDRKEDHHNSTSHSARAINAPGAAPVFQRFATTGKSK